MSMEAKFSLTGIFRLFVAERSLFPIAQLLFFVQNTIQHDLRNTTQTRLDFGNPKMDLLIHHRVEVCKIEERLHRHVLDTRKGMG